MKRTRYTQGKLIQAIAESIASDGSEQYDIAREGFKGVYEMSDEEFDQACTYYSVEFDPVKNKQDKFSEYLAEDFASGKNVKITLRESPWEITGQIKGLGQDGDAFRLTTSDEWYYLFQITQYRTEC